MDKIFIYKQDKYNLKEIKRIVEKIFQKSGFVKELSSGKTAFLKVNLLRGANPEKAVTTHPVFVRGVAEVLLKYGLKVIVGDSPAGPFTIFSLKKIYKECGLISEFENTDIELNYDTEILNIRCEDSLKLKEFETFKSLLDADLIINLPKLKTHTMMRYTGAVKNMFGAIVGLIKANYHMRLQKADNFAHHLIDLVECIKPDFNLIDGIVGMEGDGPSSGEPINSNIILGGKNPHALDKVAIDFMGFKEEDIYTVKLARQRGLFQEIDLIGNRLPNMNFKLPKATQITFLPSTLPKFLEDILLDALKANINFDRNVCISCGDCGRSCPAKVIFYDDKNLPYYDKKGCISCFCCHEVCPVDAINVKNPILASLLRG